MNKALKFLLLLASCVSGFAADVTLPLRTEAGKMATLLIRCGLPAEEARDIAIHRMADVKWWHSTFLPRFSAEQRSLLAEQLNRYLDVSDKSSESVRRAEFAELVILELLQKEKKLSFSELFDPWQAGLLMQTEDWWSRQMKSLSPQKQDQLKKLRESLISYSQKSATASGTTP